MIHEHIYAQLEQLGVIALIRENADVARSESCGYMDLHFDRLYESYGGVVISLAHYFEQNGDLCCDPDMEVLVLLERKLAEALAFQQAIPPVYHTVHPEAGKVNPALRKSLNAFLLTWLSNCLAQGHRFGNREREA